ncbi:hypothetical protein HPB49_026635 [Dermacentor silvarum]|nr:hypothetical protein HPB49_026635 [Dermacentor silvarum]
MVETKRFRHVLRKALRHRFLSSLLVILGAHDLTGNIGRFKPVSIPVRRMIVHRSYNPATFENDLALLELERPVVFQPHIYVQVPILSNQKCQKMFMLAGHVKAIRDNFVCAGYDGGNRDSCELVGLLSGFLERRRRLAGKAPVSLLGARVVALGRDLSAPPPNSSTVASDLPNLRHLPPRLSLAFFLHRSFFVTNADAACVTRLSHLVMNSA